jgi:hypothetical protein
MIVHLDMIKSRQGVILYSLIDEVESKGFIYHDLLKRLKDKIGYHDSILHNIKIQKNNIVVHRSPSLTFKEVVEGYPVSLVDIAAVSRTYYDVALKLHSKVPHQNPWKLIDRRTGTRAILRGLSNSREGLA